jgi:hypothetical protein
VKIEWSFVPIKAQIMELWCYEGLGGYKGLLTALDCRWSSETKVCLGIYYRKDCLPSSLQMVLMVTIESPMVGVVNVIASIHELSHACELVGS